MKTDKAMTITGRKHATGRPTPDDVVDAAPVQAAVWCRSVGASWTLELHELDGTIVDWISSGVPLSQPEPDALAHGLLAERGLHLFCDSSAGPCTRSRYGIGYACRDAELIKLANIVRENGAEAGMHPVALAARWVAAGFSAGAAARWIRQGVHSPLPAHRQGTPRSGRAAEVPSQRTPGAP